MPRALAAARRSNSAAPRAPTPSALIAKVNGDSELLYLLMVSLFVEEGKTQFGMEDFDFLYEREKLKSFDMKHLERGDHPLFRQGLIQYCVHNGITDRQHYRLTQKTAELFDF